MEGLNRLSRWLSAEGTTFMYNLARLDFGSLARLIVLIGLLYLALSFVTGLLRTVLIVCALIVLFSYFLW